MATECTLESCVVDKTHRGVSKHYGDICDLCNLRSVQSERWQAIHMFRGFHFTYVLFVAVHVCLSMRICSLSVSSVSPLSLVMTKHTVKKIRRFYGKIPAL